MDPDRLHIYEELKRDGYSQEERYFHERNRELIEKRAAGVLRLEEASNPSYEADLSPPRRVLRSILARLKGWLKPKDEVPNLF